MADKRSGAGEHNPFEEYVNSLSTDDPLDWVPVEVIRLANIQAVMEKLVAKVAAGEMTVQQATEALKEWERRWEQGRDG